jgi:hypothetical protein
MHIFIVTRRVFNLDSAASFARGARLWRYLNWS